MSAVEGWVTKRFDEIGTIISGSTPSTTVSAFWNGDIVWVTPYDLSRLNTPYLHDSAKRITLKGLDGCSSHLLPAGSIVMSSRAPIGYVAIPTVQFCTNQGCKSIQLKDGFTSEFTYYNILFNIDKVKNLGEGTTFAEISKTALSKVELDFPQSKPEQTKIAEILSTVDRAIEQTEALIAKQQLIKTGLMQNLLTRGIDEHGNLRSERTHEFKGSPLGRIPMEWDVKPANELCEAVIDCKNRTPPETKDGHPVIRTPNVRKGEFVYKDLAYTDSGSYRIWVARGKPRSGDVVITREAPFGEACLIPEDIKEPCLGQRMMMYQPDPEKLRADYLVYAICSEGLQKKLLEMAGGSTVGHIRVNDIRTLPIPHPKSVDEQQVIATTLLAMAGMIRKNVSQCQKLRAIKTAMMRDLLSGKKQVSALLKEAQ